VLIVDDDELVRRLLTAQLRHAGYETRTAASVQEARRLLDGGEPCALVLCDLNLPGESGLDLLADVLPRHPDLVAIMVTGVDDPGTAEAAAGLGASGYMIKPFTEKQLLINVANALRERDLRMENRAYREHLEDLVEHRTAALDDALHHLGRLAEELAASREETIRRLSIAGEYRDEETGDHVQRVGWLSHVLADRLGLGPERCALLRLASPLHDIGKVGIPDAILRKPGPLDRHERAVIESHAEIGHRILAGSDSPMLDLAATVAWAHHERFDGTGYPRRLAGEAIPLEGRIVAVADVFDALTHDRVYRRAFALDRAVEIVCAGRARHFDPAVVDAFTTALGELIPIVEGRLPDARTRVLIVEGDDGLRDCLERRLRDDGCEVVGTAASAAQALPLIHTRRPDVAIVSVSAPHDAGDDVLRHMSREPGGPRLVEYSGEGGAADAVRQAAG
jgi:putative two-component system response regulator